jgi:uncharacterized protein involved in exopolysaccharide biosynthesis
MQLNVSAMNSLQSRLQSINDALQRNSQQKLMGEQTLSSLKAQYSSLESALTTGPVAEEVTRESVAKNDEIAQLNHEIIQNEAQLAVLRQSLKEVHPDVVDFKAKLEALKARRDQMVKDDKAAQAAAELNRPKAAGPKKPAISLQNQERLGQIRAAIDSMTTQLTTIEIDSQNKIKEQATLNKDLAGFQARLDASPINEQKYASLMRERNVASDHFERLQKGQQLAAQGIDINQRKAGETLDVLDTASMPETPTAPNRWQIVAIGAGLGLLTGFAMAGAKEMKDTSLKNLKDVRAYTNLPVLSSIPLLENALLVRRKRRLAYVAWAVAVIVGLCGTAIALYYHYQISSK